VHATWLLALGAQQFTSGTAKAMGQLTLPDFVATFFPHCWVEIRLPALTGGLQSRGGTVEEPRPFLTDQTLGPSSPSPSCWRWPTPGGSDGSLGTCESQPCHYISHHYLTAERLAYPLEQGAGWLRNYVGAE